jgi:hypothetical protein
VHGTGAEDLPCAELGQEPPEGSLGFCCEVFLLPEGARLESVTLTDIATWAQDSSESPLGPSPRASQASGGPSVAGRSLLRLASHEQAREARENAQGHGNRRKNRQGLLCEQTGDHDARGYTAQATMIPSAVTSCRHRAGVPASGKSACHTCGGSASSLSSGRVRECATNETPDAMKAHPRRKMPRCSSMNGTLSCSQGRAA